MSPKSQTSCSMSLIDYLTTRYLHEFLPPAYKSGFEKDIIRLAQQDLSQEQDTSESKGI